MLTRRLARTTPDGAKFQNPNPKMAWPMPDLIVIDGGKGQLGVAVEVLKEKGLAIPVIGLAKRIEEIFFPENPEPLVLPQTSPGPANAAAPARRSAPFWDYLPSPITFQTSRKIRPRRNPGHWPQDQKTPETKIRHRRQHQKSQL